MTNCPVENAQNDSEVHVCHIKTSYFKLGHVVDTYAIHIHPIGVAPGM